MSDLGRRRHPRFALAERFSVRLQVPPGAAGGSLLNVSLAGLAYRSAEAPADGELLRLEIVDDAGELRVPSLHAHVVATSPAGGGECVVHCAFLEIASPEGVLGALGARDSAVV